KVGSIRDRKAQTNFPERKPPNHGDKSMRMLGISILVLALAGLLSNDVDAAFTKGPIQLPQLQVQNDGTGSGVVRSDNKNKQNKTKDSSSGGLIDPLADGSSLPGSTGPIQGGGSGGSGGGGGKFFDPFAPGNGGTVGGSGSSGGKFIDPFAPGNGGSG